MSDIPEFRIYGENDPKIDESIQPKLDLRDWSALKSDEKQIILQQLSSRGWINCFDDIFATIVFLNNTFLRVCPGKRVHKWQPHYIHGLLDNRNERNLAAGNDFHEIILTSSSDMVMKMLSKFAERLIERNALKNVAIKNDDIERQKLINEAFQHFDRFADCLNHIFEQFSVNILVTRTGFIPRQDEKITEYIYKPVMQILSAPKWRTVNEALSGMFDDYHEKNYAETITKAHSAVQRLLQIIVEGEEGKNGKGQFGKLFNVAKQRGLISLDGFSVKIMDNLQSFIASERATNSTAKPATKETTASEALLVMNVIMIFLQHCLQSQK